MSYDFGETPSLQRQCVGQAQGTQPCGKLVRTDPALLTAWLLMS